VPGAILGVRVISRLAMEGDLQRLNLERKEHIDLQNTGKAEVVRLS
jgi:hypothetical protein